MDYSRQKAFSDLIENPEFQRSFQEQIRQEAIGANSFIAYRDEQGRLVREYPVSGEIYEVSPGQKTLTLLSVQGVPVGLSDQVVKPLTDTAEIWPRLKVWYRS